MQSRASCDTDPFTHVVGRDKTSRFTSADSGTARRMFCLHSLHEVKYTS